MALWMAFTYIISTMIIALISPFWGLVALIGSVLIRFQDRYPIINSIPTFLLMSLAVALGCVLHRNKLGNTTYAPDIHWKRFLGWLIIGLIIMAPAAIISDLNLVISSLLIYYFCSRTLNSEGKFLILFAVITAVTIGLGYEASSEYLTKTVTEFAYTPSEDERRLMGLGRFANSNEFGALMVMALGFVFGLFLLVKNIFVKAACVAAVAYLLFVTGLTLSRTCLGVAGIMAMAAGALWGSGSVIKKGIILGFVGFGLLTALTLIPGPIQERILSVLDYESDASFQGRLRAWTQGLIMVKSHPIFGVGMAQWPDYHGRAPHNSFIQAMAETGFVGIFFYLMALFYSFKTCLQITELPKTDPLYNRRHRILAISAAITLLGFCVYAFFGNQAYTPFIYIYSGICAALSNLCKIPPGKRITPKATPDTEPTQKTRHFPQAPV